MCDGNDLEYPFEILPPTSIHTTVIAHSGTLSARNGSGILAHILDDSDDRFDLVGRSRVPHDYQHQAAPAASSASSSFTPTIVLTPASSIVTP